MKVHYGKSLTVIQFTGEEPRVVRELLTNPLPLVEKGDLLVVPENVGRFLVREGSPFERVDIASFISETNTSQVNQISDDAVATVNKLNTTIFELEAKIKIKEDELEAYELRENQEMEDLKKLNQELNEQIETIQSKSLEFQTSNETLIDTVVPSTTKKTTTKATKEETL